MNKKAIFLACMLLPAFQMLIAQQSNVKWEKWNSLIGYWEGEGNGQPGKGGGSFSFQTDLNSNILVRKGHTEFPAAKDQPASVHDDLMVIYPDNTGVATRAIYFDNEGHTINYLISYTENTIVLTSELIPNVPRFRLIYEIIDSKTVNIKFAMASPQSPEDFKTYIEGKSLKTR